MINIIKELFKQKIEDIEVGNSNVTEEGLIQIINCINDVTDNNKLYNRTQAAKHLHCSVQTFDSYRRQGKIKDNKKEVGGVLRWTKKQLDDLIRRERNGYKEKN